MGSFYQHQERGATASVAAIPALTAESPPDPVLALVEAHKAVWARLLETEGPHRRLREAGRAVDAALAEIMKTPPTTPAGARAVMEHLVEWDKDGARETSAEYLATRLLAGSADRWSKSGKGGPRAALFLSPTQRARWSFATRASLGSPSQRSRRASSPRSRARGLR
jgi:hypothetical protein